MVSHVLKGAVVDKIWLESYPQGIPAEIDPEHFRSVAAMFEDAAARFPDRVAYTNFGTTLTYRQLELMSQIGRAHV